LLFTYASTAGGYAAVTKGLIRMHSTCPNQQFLWRSIYSRNT